MPPGPRVIPPCPPLLCPLAGFDYEKAKELLKLSELYKVEIMVAIGKKGKKENLPVELQAREIPSQRKLLKEIVFKEEFDSTK